MVRVRKKGRKREGRKGVKEEKGSSLLLTFVDLLQKLPYLVRYSLFSFHSRFHPLDYAAHAAIVFYPELLPYFR